MKAIPIDDPEPNPGGGEVTIQWTRDADAAIAAAAAGEKPLLLDFSAAPM